MKGKQDFILVPRKLLEELLDALYDRMNLCENWHSSKEPQYLKVIDAYKTEMDAVIALLEEGRKWNEL